MFVSDIYDDVLEVLGRDDRAEAFKRITRAVLALQDEGDWKANIGAVDIKVNPKQTYVTLPPEVETPLAVAINHRPVFMRDEFFKFHLNGDGLDKNTVNWAWDDQAEVGAFSEIVTPGPLIALSDLNSDVGQIIRVLGWDDQGRVLRSQDLDGIWIDGVVAETSLKTGAPLAPPSFRAFRRKFAVAPMIVFSTVTPHGLATGAYMQVAVVAGSMPAPLLEGAYYYVRINTDNSITLHKTRLDSRTGQSPIAITETGTTSEISLTDKRKTWARTQFELATSGVLMDFDLVTFLATTMPVPLNSGVPYPVRMNSGDTFSIYPTLQDAQGETNAIDVSTPGSAVKIRALKPTSPLTSLNFNVRHNLLTGDQVTVENTGGELPQPLLEGATYYVRVINNYSITLHTTLNNVLANIDAIALTTLGSGTNSVLKVLPATASPGNASNISAPGHNLSQPSGTGALATASVSGGNLISIAVNNPGTGYEASPKVKITGGGGTGAVAQALVSGGQVTGFTIIAAGTGYSSAPVITLEPAGGSFVRFTTTGTLPAPITQGTVYRAEAPMTGDTFTLNSTVPEAITITGAGSGSLFLVIARTFSVGFLPQFQVDASGYSTGQAIRFYTQGILPTGSPPIDQTTLYYIRKISDNQVEIYNSQANAENLVSTTGRINIITLGSLQLYLSYEVNVTAEVRDNFFGLESSGYIQNRTDIRFETDGTLPAPLSTSDTYKASIVGGLLQILDSGGSLVTITNIGSGNHSLIIDRTLTVDPSTSLVIPDHQFSTGDSIQVETDDELPDPLVVATDYYIRVIGPDNVELYPSLAEAEDTAVTTGRITYLSDGEGLNTTYQELPPWLVSKVSQIEKPVTDGPIFLYAWDTGVTGNLALLGEIAPQVTNPRWRRIKIGPRSKESIISMRFHMRQSPILSTRDYIPLSVDMAVLCMVKCHELLFKDYVDQAERMRVNAVNFLSKRDRALDGPRAFTVQIDADITTCPDDWMD